MQAAQLISVSAELSRSVMPHACQCGLQQPTAYSRWTLQCADLHKQLGFLAICEHVYIMQTNFQNRSVR